MRHCGTRCPQAFHELGIPVTQVKNFLITHSHADHIGGLEEVALMGRYAVGQKPIIVITELFQRLLWNMSLLGGAGHNEQEASIRLSFDNYFDILRPVKLTGLPRETFAAKVGKIDGPFRVERTDKEGCYKTTMEASVVVLVIKCSACRRKLWKYDKTGPGQVLRCHKDRVVRLYGAKQEGDVFVAVEKLHILLEEKELIFYE